MVVMLLCFTYLFLIVIIAQLLRKWESRERKKARDYEKEKDREKERKSDETKEARRLKEFFEDYDDERDDVKFYKCVPCHFLSTFLAKTFLNSKLLLLLVKNLSICSVSGIWHFNMN